MSVVGQRGPDIEVLPRHEVVTADGVATPPAGQVRVPRNDPPPAAHAGRAPMALERKLPLFVALLLILVLTSAALVAYAEVRRSAVLAAEERLQRLTRQLAEGAGTTATTTQSNARAVARNPRVAAVLREGTAPPDSIGRWILDHMQSANDSSPVVQLWDPTATRHVEIRRDPTDTSRSAIVMDAGAPAGVDEARALVAHFAESPSDSGAASEFFRVGDSVFYWHGARTGRRGGYLLRRGRVSWQAAAERQLRNIIGQDVSVYLATSESAPWYTPYGVPSAAPIALGRAPGVIHYERPDGRRIAGWAPIATTPWALVFELPMASVLERPNLFLRRTGGVFFALVAAGAAIAWALGRHLARPIVALTGAAEAMAEGDYSRRVGVAGGDELERLGATFNRMAERVEGAYDALGRLQRVTAALSEALTPQEAAAVIIAEGVSVAGASAGSVMLLNAEGTALELMGSIGFSGDAMRPWARVPIDAPYPIAEAVRTGVPVFMSSEEDWRQRMAPHGLSPLRTDSRSWAAVPLVVEGRAIGVIGLSFPTARVLPEDEQAFLRALAHQCAQAIDRARLYESERAARRDADTARLAAESANRSKSEFLATMSHELRTPLNAIAGHAELLEIAVHGELSETQLDAVRRIQRGERHLRSLINDVLDFARIEAGRVELRMEAVRVGEALATLDALVATQLSAKALRYRCDVADRELAVRADRERLQQVVLNLLSNAIKFTDAGGSVQLSAEADDDVVHIHVSDTGCGIPPERIEHIFAPFVQVNTGLTRSHDGVGLGLAISSDLVRRMGGQLTVASELGRGSTFTVTLQPAGR